MYQRMTAKLGEELTGIQATHANASAVLARQEETISNLRHRLQVMRRVQLLAGVMSLVGATLIGFGVNYLTDEKTSPGLAMLGLGVLLQVFALASNLVERE